MNMDKTYACAFCGGEFSQEDINELREWKEAFWLDKKTNHFICPDCRDNLQHEDLETQLEELLNG
jgi:DNA-directed RNA polymerase subunit RPC12/RpoP